LKNPRAYTAHLVGHAHIDLSWLWRWEETVGEIAVHTFQGTLAQMRKMPGLTFAQSQPAIYEAIEKLHPPLFEEIRSMVRKGTWVPVGGMWAEIDLGPAPSAIRLLDPAGKEVPVQIIGRIEKEGRTFTRVVFIAPGVPSFGYKIFRAFAVDSPADVTTSLEASPTGLENVLQAIADEPESMSAWELRGQVTPKGASSLGSARHSAGRRR